MGQWGLVMWRPIQPVYYSRIWKQLTSSVLYMTLTRDSENHEMCVFSYSKQHSTEACPTVITLTHKEGLWGNERCFRCATK